jgi:two-component system, OmpR family, response regulator RegX3
MTARSINDTHCSAYSLGKSNEPTIPGAGFLFLSSVIPTRIDSDRGRAVQVKKSAARTGEQILVVDDDLQACKLVAFLLGEAGYRVVTTGNGAHIVPRAAHDFDLIVLDIMLPGMNGFEICRQIRQESQVPIIFISGYADIENRVTGLRGGGDDFLAKPFEPAELLARVEAVLRRRRPARILYGTQYTVHGLTLDATEQIVIGKAGRPIQLTHVETQLLHYFMAYAGSVLTTQQICETLWGVENAETRTRLPVNIYRLRMKIEQPSEHLYYIRTIRNVGYLFEQCARR